MMILRRTLYECSRLNESVSMYVVSEAEAAIQYAKAAVEVPPQRCPGSLDCECGDIETTVA